MNLAEANRLLTYVASVDGRRIDDATVIAWHSIVGDLHLADCIEAARRHFANSKDWLMPAHVREAAIKLRDERRPKHEVLSLPSRFEFDEERIERVQRGIAQCAESLGAALRRSDEQAAPVTPSDHIRERALERARRERKGARA